MSAAQVIVCERRPLWAAGIVRAWHELDAATLPLVETRHLEEFQAALQSDSAPFAIVAADLRNMARVPALLEWVIGTLPDASIVVAAPRAWRAWAPLWRAAGACHVLFSPRQLAPLARMIARHRARFAQPEATWKLAGIELPVLGPTRSG